MSARVQFMQDECRCRCGRREVGRTCSSLGVAFLALERREAEGRAGQGRVWVLSSVCWVFPPWVDTGM